MIGIMFYGFEGDVLLLNETLTANRSMASRMLLTEVSRACKLQPGFASWSGGLSAMFTSLAMSLIAMLRDFDVSMSTLEAESFANVSASSNAIAEHKKYRYLSRSRALRWFESQYCENLLCLQCDREKVACSSRVSRRTVGVRPDEMS